MKIFSILLYYVYNTYSKYVVLLFYNVIYLLKICLYLDNKRGKNNTCSSFDMYNSTFRFPVMFYRPFKKLFLSSWAVCTLFIELRKSFYWFKMMIIHYFIRILLNPFYHQTYMFMYSQNILFWTVIWCLLYLCFFVFLKLPYLSDLKLRNLDKINEAYVSVYEED